MEALTAVFVAALLECRPTEVGSARAATSSGPPAARDSFGIFDVLDDMLLEAQEELDDFRLAALNAAHNFAKMEQSFEDPLGQATSDEGPHR